MIEASDTDSSFGVGKSPKKLLEFLQGLGAVERKRYLECMGLRWWSADASSGNLGFKLIQVAPRLDPKDGMKQRDRRVYVDNWTTPSRGNGLGRDLMVARGVFYELQRLSDAEYSEKMMKLKNGDWVYAMELVSSFMARETDLMNITNCWDDADKIRGYTGNKENFDSAMGKMGMVSLKLDVESDNITKVSPTPPDTPGQKVPPRKALCKGDPRLMGKSVVNLASNAGVVYNEEGKVVTDRRGYGGTDLNKCQWRLAGCRLLQEQSETNGFVKVIEGVLGDPENHCDKFFEVKGRKGSAKNIVSLINSINGFESWFA